MDRLALAVWAALVLSAGAVGPTAIRVALLLAAGLPWALLALRLVRGRARLGAGAFAMVAAVHLVLALLPPRLSDDVYRYAWEGRVQQALGAPAPYVHPPDDPTLAGLDPALRGRVNHPALTAVYFPAAEAVFRLVARGPDPVRAVKVTMAAANLAAVLVLAWWLRRRGRPAALALVYGASPLAAAETALAGHVDALGLLALVLALALFDLGRRRRADLAAGGLFGLAALVKPPALLPLVVVLLHPRARRRRLGLLAGALAAGAVVAAPYLPAGPGLVRTLGTFAASWRGNDLGHGLVLRGLEGLWAATGLDRAGPGGGPLYPHLHLVRGGVLFSGRETVPLARWGAVPPGYPPPDAVLFDLGLWPGPLARATVAVALLLALGLLVRWQRRRPHALPPARAVLLATAAALLLSPTAFPWYWLWAAVLLPVAFEPALALLVATLPLFYLTNLPSVGLADGGPLWLVAGVHLPAALALAATARRTGRPNAGPAAALPAGPSAGEAGPRGAGAPWHGR